MFHVLRSAGLLAVLLIPSAVGRPAVPHPYTIDTMLGLESYGKAVTIPGGRFVLIERRRRYDDGGAYDYGYFSRWSLSKIFIVDLARPGALRPLFAQRDDTGYLIAGPSPGGRRIAVFRLRDHRLAIGIVTLSDRRVRWFDVAPDLPLSQPMPVWIDDDHLLISTFTKPQLPWLLLFGNAYQRGVANRWRAQRRGLRPTATVVGNEGTPSLPPYNRLMCIDVRSGKREVLLDGVPIYDFQASPDHRQIAVMTVGDAVTPPIGQPIAVDYIDRRHRLVVGALGGRPRSLRALSGDYLPDILSWSPDGTSLLAYRRDDTAPWPQGRLVRIDGAHTRILRLEGADSSAPTTAPWTPNVRAAWLGNDVIARATDARGSSVWRLFKPGARHRVEDSPDGALTVTRDGAAAYRLTGRELTVLDTRHRWRLLDRDTVSLGVDAEDGMNGSRAALNPVSDGEAV